MADLGITQRLVSQSKTVEFPAYNHLSNGHGRKLQHVDEKTNQNRAGAGLPISVLGGSNEDFAQKLHSSDAHHDANPEFFAATLASGAGANSPISNLDAFVGFTSNFDSFDAWLDAKLDSFTTAPASREGADPPISDLDVFSASFISNVHPSDARLAANPEPFVAALTSDSSEVHLASNWDLSEVRLALDLDSPDARCDKNQH